MLPFLKPKQVSGLIIRKRMSDGGSQEQHSEGNEDHALEACAEDILRAMASKDAKSLAGALRAAFECMESGEGSDSNDYDSQNQKAAQEAKE